MKRSVAGWAVLLATAGCTQAEVVHTGSAASTTHAATHSRPRPPAHQRAVPVESAKPTTRDAACPYLDTAFVMDTVGQHLVRTTVTTTVPESCAFYRPDGALAARVVGSRFRSPQDAAAKIAGITGSAANPVSIGDGGSVAITGDSTVLAVSSGPTLLVVYVNQQSSLEATEIAKQALARL